MPYKDISELPEPVKSSLPQHGQEIYMAAYNSAAKQGKDEETCAKIAWGAVKKSYEKVDGEWKKAGNLVSSPELINKEHDVILERLNQTLHYQDHGDIFYSEQPFLNSINKWDGIPIIFANEHPDFNAFDDDPNKELKNIKGAIVGRVTAPKVELTGTSRVEAIFSIDNPVIENLIKEGKIAHSPGFRYQADSKNHLTSVSPHHVLIFIQDAKNQPRDKGAMILNKEDTDTMTEDGILSDIKNKDPKKPYGEVDYADPGYQEDGVYRYPLDTKAHADAAWKYINMPKNAAKYTAGQLAKIKAKIESAAKKFGITIANMETDMANKDYTKEDMDAMLDFMKANPGMMDKSTMDKMYAAMDGANQKEYMKSMLKDLQSHPEMMDDEMESMMEGMKNKEQETKGTMGKEDELTKQLEISNKEKETLTGELKGAKEALEIANKQLKVFEQNEATRKAAEEESRWQELKNKLPVGLTHKEEDVKALRDAWISNKDEFYMKHFVNATKPELPGEEGKEIVNRAGEQKAPSVGNWNPRTQKWEEA